MEDCVNRVGVDLNTASASLLEYISGISKTIAKNIVEYRETNGRFTNRKQLLKVAKLGPKAFEQCAGFMRIQDGDNPLDATSVHPESYEATMKLLDRLDLTMEDVKKLQAEAKSVKAALRQQPAAPQGRGQKPKPQNQKNIVIRNTNTAMGKALAAAMGGAVLQEEPAGKKQLPLPQAEPTLEPPPLREQPPQAWNAVSVTRRKWRKSWESVKSPLPTSLRNWKNRPETPEKTCPPPSCAATCWT